MSAWLNTRRPSRRKSTSPAISALRSRCSKPILNSSVMVVLLSQVSATREEPHHDRLRQRRSFLHTPGDITQSEQHVGDVAVVVAGEEQKLVSRQRGLDAHMTQEHF